MKQALAKLKARPRFNGVQEFLAHGDFVVELRHLEEIHAGAGCGEALLITTRTVDAKCWEQVL